MTVVLDTNVVLQARAAGHAYRRILEGWLAGRLTLAVGTEILLEYEEVMTARLGVRRWQELLAAPDAGAEIHGIEPVFLRSRWSNAESSFTVAACVGSVARL